MYLEMQLVDSRHVPRMAFVKFLAVPRVQHYFHNPFRQFPVSGCERNGAIRCECRLRCRQKGGAQISGRGGAAAWETKEPCSAASL